MLSDVKNSGENITEFDFNDPATRERMLLWMALTTNKIRRGEKLTDADFLKVAELLEIIQQKETYKVPYRRGERKGSFSRDQQLVCWYRITLETQLGIGATEAKQVTADRFLISQKLVEAYCTRHRKGIERMIETFGYDEIAPAYIMHLSLYRRGTEHRLTELLAKYPI